MRRSPHALTATLAVLVAALMPSAAHAFCRLTTVQNAVPGPDGCITQGIPLSWDRQCLSYTIGGGGTPTLQDAELSSIVSASFASWSDVSCGGEQVLSFQRTEQDTPYDIPFFDTRGGNHNAILFVDDWEERDHDSRAFALTTVWHDKTDGRIVDADMEVNEMRGTLSVCPENNRCDLDAGCTDVDIENVITHEVGHFIGLAHSNVADATMFDSAPIGETCKQSLEEDDRGGLCAAYGNASFASECNFTPNGGLNTGAPNEDGGCSCRTAVPPGSEGLWLWVLLGLAFTRRMLPKRWQI